MRVRPISPQRLVTELTQRLARTESAGRLRVAVDGPAAARPDQLAAALVDPLRALGRPARHIRAEDFLRPASVRLERGRTNPDAYYEGWVDEAGLRREVLDPAGPAGTGRILPSLWDARADRASRAGYVELPSGGVVLVSGAFLLGGGLPFDVTVHLELSAAALSRHTAPDLAWTLPAYARYAAEVAPATFADLVVRVDDPRRPAIVESVDDPV
ncbi:uridine kinase [Micromonospora zingiberis]|uniref:Uridine kinase n=1 Tax=Micromonospora zingiberis TaxID=2053011 RepID=A0A4R0GB35_9ACTN|nr:uridine kinase [Micromonospora zingiberis]TCB94274.1 uridine kinase [Micromonospora zingiberis]